ncbi:Peptidoglycan-binding domain 1 protein [Parvibaculum lavamentivorans DS-1]|uniref:Peptidoglycan-binding domain 1 protein n=1 Tax=Parvibaculum lavamentivorans (strain DS-1 / DSM 13023 / NCIMB 13966) TaxID=402881 RepID=A7HRM9_PARL1|nr:peptidoglycan-binding protein [Parvibaculum lavamentivorans]ABS62562.1 Peptidoglycan-binding domain 1 protein [Parvibaculum lavamentivorans DS-1]
MLSELQKEAAKAIVNIFETGAVRGDYARVTLLAGDSGHLTYGRAQTTLGSGNLHLLIKAYCEAPGAAYARACEPYLPRLADIDLRLDSDWTFRNLLKEAGADPVMRDTQDAFFDRVYWTPAAASAIRLGLTEALSLAIVYDSVVHGSWISLRDRTLAKAGQPSKAGERAWSLAYVRERRNWLAMHSNTLLRKTIYRMEAFEALIAAKNWSLALPMTVRGIRIDEPALGYRPPVTASATDVTTRNLRLTSPRMTGNDVRALEAALVKEGYAINCDGVFDEGLEKALKSFQQDYGLIADGVAGPATRIMLGI